MAVSSISQLVSSLGARDNQAQSGDAQNTPLTTQQIQQAASQTQLSASGKVRLSLEDLQSKAQALKDFSRKPTVNDFKALAQGFVQSVNNLRKTVDDATSAAANKQKPSNADVRALNAKSEVSKALVGPGDASLTALGKLGIDRQKDGSFSINSKNLDNALNNDRAGTLNAFAALADRVGNTIDKQLPSNGSNGNKVQNLNSRTNESDYSGTQSRQQFENQRVSEQRFASQQISAGGYVARKAVTTYFSVASM